MPPLNAAATIIMDSLVARNLKGNEGHLAKQDFARHMSEKNQMPAERFWNTDYVDMLASEARTGVEPYGS